MSFAAVFARPVSCVAVLRSFGCWRYSLPRWRLWKTWSQTVFNPVWKRPLGSLRQSQPRSAPCLPHFRGLGPRSRSPLPRAAPQSFSWLHSAQPAWATGLSVKSCPAAPPDCSVSSHRCSGSLASVAGLVEPRSAASAARVPALWEPRAAAAGPGASAVGRLVEVGPLAPLRQGVANGVGTAGETDVTPNVRCGVRVSVKISPALQCEPAAPTPHLMMMSTTPATPLLLFADAFTAPALLSHLSELDELTVALSCRFALDIFTVAQQYQPLPESDLLVHDPGHNLLF